MPADPPSQPITARLPKVGSRWIWEIDSPYARTLIEVEDVRWNGEEWWTYLRQLRTDVSIAERGAELQPEPDGVYPNELDRFWEAATPVGGRREDLTETRTP